MATFPTEWVRSDARTARQARDPAVWCVAAVAALASVAAVVFFGRRGDLLSYFDTAAHMTIARQVLDNSSGHLAFGQLGAVWLPLPHLLALPFVWNDSLFYSGLAGAFQSMGAYVVLGVYVYKIVRDLTGSLAAALAATVVMLGNANVLYMQSVPMTELVLFGCIAAMVYYLQRWIQTDRWGYLVAAGIAADLGCLTRYEAWVVLVAATGAVAIVLHAKRATWRRAQDVLLGFVLFAFLSIGLWLLWNQLIFGNALTFQTSKYAKPSNWVNQSDIAVGAIGISIRAYWYAILENAGIAVIVAGSLGLCVAVARKRMRLVVLPTLSVLSLIPFFILSLYKGQRPLHVLQLNDNLYNVRFGLLILLPLAIGIGCLLGALSTGWLRRGGAALAIAVVLLTSAWQFGHGGGVLVKEPDNWLTSPGAQKFHGVSDFLRSRYDERGGTILASYFGNEYVLFWARIAPGHNINEGSFKIWDQALEDPVRQHVQWIVMRDGDRTDPVYADVYASAALTRSYRLVYRRLDYLVYERRG
jgi:hypothetical protein